MPVYWLPEYVLVINTRSIVGSYGSKTDSIGDWYNFYYDYCEIEKNGTSSAILYWVNMIILYPT